MADLERDAFQRDRRFLLRLILVLIIGTAAGVWMFFQLTGERVAGCAANAFGGVTETPGSE
ncbi:MAG: hypothetical protein KC457_27395 [Myxococcales bacterium]|nr:hypothetical protein [Myxococcales bacterium]